MLKRFIKLLGIIRYFFEDEDTLTLYLLEKKAQECMRDCEKLSISNIEELEDLVFHIRTYLEIPRALVETKYPQFRNVSVQKIIKKFKQDKTTPKEIEKYGDFLIEVETHRSLERDIIFDHAKFLPFGFSL